MKYRSTRGRVSGATFRDALFSGYTSDGGLFVPETIPSLPLDVLEKWSRIKPTYPEVVLSVVRLFIAEDEISDQDLQECVTKAYAKFDVPEIIRVKEGCKTKGPTTGSQMCNVAELFHGPTASFKDYALCLVGPLMEHFVKSERKCGGVYRIIVLVGTSGDTGSAAIKAMEGLDGIDIIVLYPGGGQISPVQELQMNSSMAKNVHVFAVEGNSDDLDVPIRQCFPDKSLCSINSINWARIMIQISHFVYLYFTATDGKNEDGSLCPLDIFVPTGAVGNGVSGLVASLMGIPIRLHLATNENDNVYEFLERGVLRMGGPVIPTPANAMDIKYPYNLERLIYFTAFTSSNGSVAIATEVVSKHMSVCESGGHESTSQIEEELMMDIRRVIVDCQLIDTHTINETIKECWSLNEYMICPHTATAVAAVGQGKAILSPVSVVIATASPQKFPEVVEEAVGIGSEKWNRNFLLQKLKSEPQSMPNTAMTKATQAVWYDILKREITNILDQ